LSAPGVPGVGIKITSPTGGGPQGGQGEVIFTTKYPFAKLDTQLGIDPSTNPPKGPVSFQNISIFFNTDPPTPSGTTTTQVYTFAHGYNYVPTYWVLYRNDNASNDSAAATYGTEGSIIKSTSEGFNYAQLVTRVDHKNFNISVLKSFLDGSKPAANIVGYTIKLRVYIFTDPGVVN
jgi:hypothetical protein